MCYDVLRCVTMQAAARVRGGEVRCRQPGHCGGGRHRGLRGRQGEEWSGDIDLRSHALIPSWRIHSCRASNAGLRRSITEKAFTSASQRFHI